MSEKAIMLTEQKASNLVRATIQGTIWSYATTYSAKILVFISTVILARLLLQEDYGVAGYALVIMSFIEILEGLGIGQALIYYDRAPERANTGFWLSLAAGVGLMLITYFIAAPIGGWFFKDPRAVEVTRLLSLSLPISALGLVHEYLLIKALAFKQKFLPELAKALAKGVVSIVLALSGWGAWSLIWGQLAGTVVSVIAFWIVIPWRPTFGFDKAAARSLLSYGLKIISNGGISIFLYNLDYLLIGHYMGAAALGVYTLAFRMPELLIKEFSTVIGRVMFPVYAKMKDDGQRLSRGFLLTLQYVNMITVPLGLGLALVAKPFVLIAFTERWAEAIPVMSALALFSLLRAMVFNVGDAYKAQGRPGLLAQIHMGQALISIPLLWWAAAVYGTIIAVAWSQLIVALIASIVKLLIAGYILNISLSAIFKALQGSLAAGAVMTVAVLGSLQLGINWPPLWQLIFSVVIGGLTYLATLWLLHRNALFEAGQTLRASLSRR
jgi:PST family polysaccharide transporter